MNSLERARKLHAGLLEINPPDMATADVEAAIRHLDGFLSKPGLEAIQIKRARSARSYLRLVLK